MQNAMSKETASPAGKRKIKVWSSVHGTKTVETTATTWGTLKRDLDSAGVKYSGMQAINGANKQTIQLDDANVESLTTVFLVPEKTKSGAETVTARKIISAMIKKATVQDALKMKKFFVDANGQNYTRVKEEELQKLLNKWEKKAGTPVTSFEKAAAPKKAAAKKTATPAKKATTSSKKATSPAKEKEAAASPADNGIGAVVGAVAATANERTVKEVIPALPSDEDLNVEGLKIQQQMEKAGLSDRYR